jgi:hypothetical protein
MIGVLQFYQIYISPVMRFVPPVVGILILWIGLVRAGFSSKARTTGLLVTVLLLAWWVASDLLGRSGLYTQHWDVTRPIGWTIAILCVIPLMRSATIAAALDALPLWLLPAAQVYRVGGGLVWFGLVASGRMPATGLVPGIADTLVGILALVIGVYLYSGARGGRILAIAWNVLGLLDFAVGFIIGSFFVPVSVPYPAVIIPAFMAPFSLDLHALSLRQLIRAGKREQQPTPTLANAKIA